MAGSVFTCKLFDCPFFHFDFRLNLISGFVFGKDLLGCYVYQIVFQDFEAAEFAEDRVHTFDGFDAGKLKHVFDFGDLGILKHVDELSVCCSHFLGVHDFVPSPQFEAFNGKGQTTSFLTNISLPATHISWKNSALFSKSLS